MTEDFETDVSDTGVLSERETPGIGDAQSKDDAEIAEGEDQKPLYNKRQMTDVIKRERARAAEKARKEVIMELQQQQMEYGGSIEVKVSDLKQGL